MIDKNVNRIDDALVCVKNCACWIDCRLDNLAACPHFPEGIRAEGGAFVYPSRQTGPDLAAQIAYVGTRAPVSPLVRGRVKHPALAVWLGTLAVYTALALGLATILIRAL